MRILLVLAALISMHISYGQSITDTIHVGDLDLRYLPTGKQQYLVYLLRGTQKKNIWLWERTTTREYRNNEPVIVIRQQWNSSDTGFNSREITSVVNEKNFTPVYHTTLNPKTGREAFNFTARAVVTADTVTDVTKKGFNQPFSTPSFNWELDLETFPLLPLKEGKTFVINFYHPGSKTPPKWYNYTVTGTEKINTVNGEKIDCYKLYTAYENNQGNSTWWLSKKAHEVLKMEEHYGPVTRYKIKLAASE